MIFRRAQQGRVVKEEIPTKRVNGMQAWVFNLRREKFQDIAGAPGFRSGLRFRLVEHQPVLWPVHALAQPLQQFGHGSNGPAVARGAAILEPLRDKIPAEVFTTEYQSPTNDTPQNRRKNLRAAAKLLDEAGWKVTQDGGNSVLKNAKGEAFAVELLLDSPLFERIALPYKEQLELLGITVTIKSVDSAQYERQNQSFEFDIVSNVWGQSLSPGNEQREFWGSAAADKNGSRNLAGIKDAAVDSIIETLIFAKDRAKPDHRLQGAGPGDDVEPLHGADVVPVL